MITVKIIDHTYKNDINIKNEPFKLFGRMIPSYSNEQWNYSIERFAEESITEICFPDENHNWENSQKAAFLLGPIMGINALALPFCSKR